MLSSECVSDREARRSRAQKWSDQTSLRLRSWLFSHPWPPLWCFHLPWYLLPPGTGSVAASALHTGRPHDSGLEDADEGELGSWLCIWRRGHREWRTNRKVGTCPVTSSCRMIFVTSSFGVCLQTFLVVLAAGPPPTLRSLLPLRSVPGLAVFCQWPDSGNS